MATKQASDVYIIETSYEDPVTEYQLVSDAPERSMFEKTLERIAQLAEIVCIGRTIYG